VSRKLFSITATLALMTLFTIPNTAAPSGITSLLANARGKGTVTIGREVLPVSNVVVKLMEDGTGEIILVTDLQLFVTCTWSAPADLSKGIDLKITGGTNPGGAQGSGNLLLRSDGKEINKLSLAGSSNTSKRKIQVEFVA